MMKQIINWTCGSFFRTIGRVACYFIIGGIIAYFVSNGFSKGDFRITDLFGIQKINASTMVENVNLQSNSYYTLQDENNWTTNWDYYKRTITSTTNNNINQFDITFAIGQNLGNNVDYVEIPFSVSQPIVNTQTNTISNFYCTDWGSVSGSPSYDYYCMGGDADDNNIDIPYQVTLTNLNFTFRANYSNSTFSYCNIQNNTIICPNAKRIINSITVQTTFKTASQTSILFVIYRSANNYVKDKSNQDIVNAENQQTQQQQQQHNETMQTITDTNATTDTSSASDFMHDYNETSQDSIKAIVSLPLNIFNALTTGSTQDLCFTLKGKQSCLPSGDILWGKSSRTSIHVGNATFTPTPFGNNDIPTGISAFKVLFNIVVSGYLGYKMLKSLMRITNNMLSPTHDKIEVLEL